MVLLLHINATWNLKIVSSLIQDLNISSLLKYVEKSLVRSANTWNSFSLYPSSLLHQEVLWVYNSSSDKGVRVHPLQSICLTDSIQ